MRRSVIGILAHVDAGKTTLSEALLYACGSIKKIGRVDHQNAFLDTYPLERERGITIFSKQAVLPLREDMELMLLDTPGHVDFSTEMERPLQVLDYAILVISGTDGVQSHTQTLWRLLKTHHIPTFLFINKMDLAGADAMNVMNQLRNYLDEGCISFSCDPSGEDFLESVAMRDEALLNRYLDQGDVPQRSIKALISSRRLFPCYFGSALKLTGIEEFVDGLAQYIQFPKYPQEFGAKVYKIARDPQGNRLTYMKITGGNLRVRALLSSSQSEVTAHRQWEEKVTQIRIYSGARYQAVEQVDAGAVCAVTGLNYTYAGQGLGTELTSPPPQLTPVLTYQVLLPEGCDPHSALTKLRQLEEEDPMLHIRWDARTQEIHMQPMGEVQLEIMKKMIEDRFQLSVDFGTGSIVYRETIANSVEGIGHFEPLRHYAEVHLLLEPAPRGSGLQFYTDCSEDILDRNWQRLILTHLQEKEHLGVLTGSPITDMDITLLTGRAHIKHTEGGDFRQATYRALRQGLMQADNILLEPYYEFRLEVPSESVGRAMADLQRMCAVFNPPEIQGDMSTLTGSAPVATMRDYPTEVTSYTRGRGRLLCSVKGYEPCHNQEEVIQSTGYDSESDTENPADSVFCSHGSGFIVKWDQVRNHMHLDSGLRLHDSENPGSEIDKENSSSAERGAASPVSYSGTREEDKELMDIFQRTYGEIQRRTLPPQSAAAQKIEEPHTLTLNQEPEYLLVDGYNIIFAWDELKALSKDNIESARQALIHILSNYQGFQNCTAILVFDAYKVKQNPGSVIKDHNIFVVYTKEAETADAYIEKVTYELGKKHRVRVATSDRLEQMIILGHGATRVSAREFHEEIERVNGRIAALIQRNNEQNREMNRLKYKAVVAKGKPTDPESK